MNSSCLHSNWIYARRQVPKHFRGRRVPLDGDRVNPALCLAALQLASSARFPVNMASPESVCYTVVFEDSSETPSIQELRSALEKGSDEVKLETLRKIIVSTINGNQLVRSESSNCRETLSDMYTAPAFDAYHPIRATFKEQAAQEAAAFLLGGVPEIRREWEAEARDDPCMVRA